MNLNEATTQYDSAFASISGLTWLPWVGQNYSTRPSHKRLLVVGESHYFIGKTSEERLANREGRVKYLNYTRAVVSESLVNYEWTTKTLDTIPKLLIRSQTSEIDRPRMWGDSAYYNLVQRIMDYSQEGQPERPAWNDYLAGWQVFADVVKIIQPSHCLFIGVSAANSFNHWIATQSAFCGNITCTQKIGGTWARAAKLENVGTNLSSELAFVKHLGLPFSWAKWNEYLQGQHSNLISWLQNERYNIHNS